MTKKVAVVGSGTMGSGIVTVLLANDVHVVWKTSSPHLMEGKVESVMTNLSKMVKRQKIDKKTFESARHRLEITYNFEELSEVEIVLEAVIESIDVKIQTLRSISDNVASGALIASNTSSLSITELSTAVDTPSRFMGLHFFNPAHVLELVEVVPGLLSDDCYIEKAHIFIESLQKSPVHVKEAPGFVVNRILIPLINEATEILEEGIASLEDIDKAMILGANHPMGPLKLADLIGLDVVVSILDSMYGETGRLKYKPSPRLRRMVKANLLGRKAGKGFYSY